MRFTGFVTSLSSWYGWIAMVVVGAVGAVHAGGAGLYRWPASAGSPLHGRECQFARGTGYYDARVTIIADPAMKSGRSRGG